MGCWGGIGKGRRLAWLLGGGQRLVLPPHPGTAAWLSSAPGNVLGFLGAMPEHGEARGDAVLPWEALLPAAFPGWQPGKETPLARGCIPPGVMACSLLCYPYFWRAARALGWC